MRERSIYKFCPISGHPLRRENRELLVCTSCGYHFYINPKPCNCVIIENENKEILLVKRKYPPKKGQWDLPGGFIVPDESFETSLKREVWEELHSLIEIEPTVRVYEDFYIYKGIRYPTLTIVAIGKLSTSSLIPGDDISAYDFVPRKNVLTKRIAFSSIRKALEDYLH